MVLPMLYNFINFIFIFKDFEYSRELLSRLRLNDDRDYIKKYKASIIINKI